MWKTQQVQSKARWKKKKKKSKIDLVPVLMKVMNLTLNIGKKYMHTIN